MAVIVHRSRCFSNDDAVVMVPVGNHGLTVCKVLMRIMTMT
jgi:hypothetical protein